MATQFYFSHLMSWPHLPETFARDHDSAWAWVPNALYDPDRGRGLYAEYLDTLSQADELGFDGVCVSEHHQTPYALTPSPSLIAAALTQRTRRCKVAVVGNALPLHNAPVRVAEELAMLDVMSGGRLVAGVSLGGGPDYFSCNVDPTTAREKFAEALALILKAWTTPGPFPWNGKHYFVRYVNPWPRPLQQPHPPVWVSGLPGSAEAVELAARHRLTYIAGPYFHIEVLQRALDRFREACTREGHAAGPERVGWAVPVYVAETDRQAREEFEPHLWRFVRDLMRNISLTPPGYFTPEGAVAMLRDRKHFLAEQTTWDQVEKGGFAVVGGPDAVRQRLEQYQKQLGAGIILAGCQVGTVPHQQARRSMALLAREVLPRLR